MFPRKMTAAAPKQRVYVQVTNSSNSSSNYDGDKRGGQVTLLYSDKYCVNRRSKWIVGPTKHCTLSWQ